MSNTPLTIKTPGKLMVAGEFAVLVPHQRIVVMAVDRFVYATIQSSITNTLTLESFQLHNVTWKYTGDRVHIHSTTNRTNYVENAMTTALTYLKERAVSVDSFHLTVRSELDDASGLKYGLGSSAAVVTSVITAILKKFLPTEPAATLIFKLAAITHVKTQGSGSGADIAASTFGGISIYTSFQSEWLKKMIRTASTLTELVDEKWIYWSVQPIQLPEEIHLCIGWTGMPASTSKLVPQILQLQQDNPTAFQQFLDDSQNAVTHFLRGVRENNIPLLLEGVKRNRKALAEVGDCANTVIETPLLGDLCDAAERYGGAGKPSGAGGGDCGIAFMTSEREVQELMQAWASAGIKPLSLSVESSGAAGEASDRKGGYHL